MLKIIFISFIFLTTLTANVNFKEGVINYSISGSENGIKTIYFRDYGAEQLIYIKTKCKLMRKNQIVEKIIHVTPTWIYERDLITDKSKKTRNLKHKKLDIVLKQEIRILGFHSKTEIIEIEKKPVNPEIFSL